LVLMSNNSLEKSNLPATSNSIFTAHFPGPGRLQAAVQ
jgi:hypothetical protein